MKTTSNALTVALAFVVGVAAIGASALATIVPASAEAPGRNWITVEQATHAIAKQGYQVIEIEADNGHWEGEMVKNGQKYDFHADPRTGRLTKVKRDRD